MALTYIDFYHAIHRIANRGRKSPRGRKYSSAYWLRANEKDPNTIELLLYHWGTKKVIVRGKDDRWERLAPKYRPYFVVASFTPRGFTITNQHQYQKVVYVFPQAALDEYTNEELNINGYGPSKCADITLNGFLGRMTPRMYQHGNGVVDKPGLLWTCDGESTNIEGPVQYDAATNKLTAIWPQREKVVKVEERKRITKALSHAFKRLKVLTTMGVEISRTEIDEARRVSFSPVNKHRQSIPAFLEAAASFDPVSHASTVHMVAWAETLMGYQTYRWHQPKHPLLDKGGLATFRRFLHRKMNVVTYE